jgi:hypothetical protein
LLAVIATAADPKYGVTSSPAAKPLAESIFSIVSHSHRKARLDNRHRPCQLMHGYLENLSTRGCCQWTPVADHDRGLLLLNLPQETTRLKG